MDKEGSNVHLQRTIFFALLRCLNEVMGIDNKAHSCEKGDKCVITLLTKVFQHMRGNGPDIDSQVKDWIEGAQVFAEPFHLLRQLFEETQRCDKSFFSPLIAQISEEVEEDCECKYTLAASKFQAVCVTLPASKGSVSVALEGYWRNRETCNYCGVDRIHVRECNVYPKIIPFRILRRGPLQPFGMAFSFKFQDVMYQFRAAITNENGKLIPYSVEENELFAWKPKKVKIEIYQMPKFYEIVDLIFYEKIPDGMIEQQQQGPEWDLQNQQRLSLLLELLQKPENQVICIRKKLAKSDVEYNSYLLLPFREVEAYLDEGLRGKNYRDVLQFQTVRDIDTQKQYNGLQLQYRRDGYRLIGGWKTIVQGMRLKAGETIELHWEDTEELRINREEGSTTSGETKENDTKEDASS